MYSVFYGILMMSTEGGFTAACVFPELPLALFIRWFRDKHLFKPGPR